MTGRRSFLALAGGSVVSGTVLHRARATAPGLVLPPAFLPVVERTVGK